MNRIVGKTCPTCSGGCIQVTCRSEKNRGKKFWGCPNKCKTWIGWVMTKDFVSTSKPVYFEVVHYCSKCDNTINEKKEIKELRKMFPQKSDVELLNELTDSDYVCFNCVNQLKKII